MQQNDAPERAETDLTTDTPASDGAQTEVAAEHGLPAPDTTPVADTATAPTPDVLAPEHVPAPEKKRSVWKIILHWTILTFGSIMMACSVYFFQAPNNFTLGGIGGISIIIAGVQNVLKYSHIMLIINVILLIIGFIILGKGCTFRTIYCTLVYTGFQLLLEYVLPLEKPVTAQWILDGAGQIVLDEAGNKLFTAGQPFLELCYAILLFGIGGALLFNSGASSGGTDIIALILKKYTKLNVGVSLMIVDFTIVIISIFTFKDVPTVLYSVLGLFAYSFLLDGVIENLGKTKYITIITKNPELIGEYILKVINHGYTMYDAEGGYTGEKKKVMITVCKRSEALRLKAKVKGADPDSFVIITDANEILGKGFGGTL